MLYLGIVIGLLIGAVVMHLRNKKMLGVINNTLHETQDKLKSVKSQLYKRRTSYKKKSPNTQANGKKTARKKTTTNSKNSNIQ
jgi:hypothetical protein|tara:strand:+ start:288 stop:536 length:249 start_codon:yes stop_codon:yes gene_type:complete